LHGNRKGPEAEGFLVKKGKSVQERLKRKMRISTKVGVIEFVAMSQHMD
jgi:hypothetical protein